MRRLTFIFGISFFVAACAQKDADKLPSIAMDELVSDTIIGRKAITNEIPGSAYRTRATEYFLVIRGGYIEYKFYLRRT